MKIAEIETTPDPALASVKQREQALKKQKAQLKLRKAQDQLRKVAGADGASRLKK